MQVYNRRAMNSDKLRGQLFLQLFHGRTQDVGLITRVHTHVVTRSINPVYSLQFDEMGMRPILNRQSRGTLLNVTGK